jgi:hypothetical protein
VGVAGVLAPLAAGFVLDSADKERAADIRALGLRVTCVPTLMHDAESAATVARAALSLA